MSEPHPPEPTADELAQQFVEDLLEAGVFRINLTTSNRRGPFVLTIHSLTYDQAERIAREIRTALKRPK